MLPQLEQDPEHNNHQQQDTERNNEAQEPNQRSLIENIEHPSDIIKTEQSPSGSVVSPRPNSEQFEPVSDEGSPLCVREKRDIEADVIKLAQEKWPEMNGVYDGDGEWHDWNEITYGYSYNSQELIILPYTVCLLNLHGAEQQQCTTESSSN